MRSSIYSTDEWKIIENRFNPSLLTRNETIFSLGNGYLGLRGDFEESYCNTANGTYINGFYETVPLIYEEKGYGYPVNQQVMVNLQNGKVINIFIDNDPFDLSTGRIIKYNRTLYLDRGFLQREILWESPSGKKIELKIKRIVSFTRRHLSAIEYSVKSIDSNPEIIIESKIDGKTVNQSSSHDPRMSSNFKDEMLSVKDIECTNTWGALCEVTKNSGLLVLCGVEHQIETRAKWLVKAEVKETEINVRFEIPSSQGEEIKLFKYIAYYTSLDSYEDKLFIMAKNEVAKAKKDGFKKIYNEQCDYLKDFWHKSDVVIESDSSVQQSIRYNLFSLIQSAGRDGKRSIAAKGLTGEGYEGHYFWDTEIYVLPFFIYTNPEIARSLLEYRYSILDKAKKRAGELSQKGALYPWRTINGDETSAYFPAGTAQYHINADIIYGLRKYLNATDDIDFLTKKGAGMIFETARLWPDLGDYSNTPNGEFFINEVTGPDEYTALVNNNTYTNMMVKDHLEYAVDTIKLLKTEYPDEYKRISMNLKLTGNEIKEWEKVSSLMYIPFDKGLGIHPQDDSFLKKAVWDINSIPEENFPLLLHYHPLVIYRYQILKQPDVVLASFLQGNRFSMADKRRNFNYYDSLTTGDSSLSPCIQSVIAAEIGFHEKAYYYFMKTARMDLDDINKNVKDGVHTAAMAGTWISLVYGFAGMRDYNGELSFNPVLPSGWKRLSFRLSVKKCLLEIDITHNRVCFTLISGNSLALVCNRKPVKLLFKESVAVNLKPEIEAVIFDLDGVITNTAEYHYQAWKKLAVELNIPFNKKTNEQLKGISRIESLDIILKKSKRIYNGQEKYHLTEKKNNYYKMHLEKITPSDLLPGIANLLFDLKKAGIKIGLASASRNAKTVINNLKIKELFDVIIDPSECCKGKPDPEQFYLTADALNIIYKNCVGIEDSQAGISAIKKAGMFAVGIGAELSGADWKLSKTSELTLKGLYKRIRAEK